MIQFQLLLPLTHQLSTAIILYSSPDILAAFTFLLFSCFYWLHIKWHFNCFHLLLFKLQLLSALPFQLILQRHSVLTLTLAVQLHSELTVQLKLLSSPFFHFKCFNCKLTAAGCFLVISVPFLKIFHPKPLWAASLSSTLNACFIYSNLHGTVHPLCDLIYLSICKRGGEWYLSLNTNSPACQSLITF